MRVNKTTMKKHPILSLFLSAFLFSLALIIFYCAFKESRRERQIESEVATLQSEADAIRKSNSELEEKISYFETAEFQEKVAKEKLNFQKEGESVAIIKPAPSYLAESENNQEEKTGDAVKEDIPNYKKWWNKLFQFNNN